MSNDVISILLIDDNFCDATLIRMGLERSGLVYNFVHKKDGPSALSYLKDCQDLPSVIILDLNLPIQSGHEILDHLRHSDRCKNIPVVILSSSDYETDVNTAYKRKANAYFSKPLNLEGYTRILKQIVQFHPHYNICREDPNFRWQIRGHS